jgi:hypothetical protein
MAKEHRTSMSQPRWLTWPVQVPQPTDFVIEGLNSPFRAYDTTEQYDSDCRITCEWVEQAAALHVDISIAPAVN